MSGTITIDSTTQWYGSTGPQPEADVVVLHTTESASWPGYAGGGNAPHDTLQPLAGVGIRVRKHIPYSSFAKALVNLPGGVETNRRGAIQLELMGTCDPKMKNVMYYWPEADDAVLSALADYLRPLMEEFRIAKRGAEFEAYPASYGNSYGTNGLRFSMEEWLAFSGICGHQHIPENLHGDPGKFPIERLLAFINDETKPITNTTPPPSVKRPNKVWKPGLDEDGVLGRQTVLALQRILGTPQDGKISKPSMMVEALQKFLKSKDISVGKSGADGLGFAQDGVKYDTVKALQKYLKTPQDGIMSKPSSTVVRALQHRLNTGRL